eukprot:4465413-Alexandrium_andersonii.AAC.1
MILAAMNWKRPPSAGHRGHTPTEGKARYMQPCELPSGTIGRPARNKNLASSSSSGAEGNLSERVPKKHGIKSVELRRGADVLSI